MYSMVLMAALTTGVDMPDRRGGCHGCRGGGWGGCYGMGMGWGGWGGCYGMGMGMGWGGCYGMGMGWGGRGYGYGGYALGGYSPMIGGYAYSPIMSTGAFLNPGMTRSFYSNPAMANEATLIVHLPEAASLSIDGQPMRQSSGTRIFTSPPLEPGKTYIYTVTAVMDRNGHTVRDSKNVEVRPGQRTEVTMDFGKANRREEETSEPAPRSSPRQPPSP